MHRLRAAAILLAATAVAETARAQTYHMRPERARRPLEIPVEAGDRIRLDAGGCFRTPASPGSTESLLVPLLQPDRDAEQGLVFIPGVTMTFLPMADLLGRDLDVSRAMRPPRDARIWIDWGRFPRSPLENASGRVLEPLACDMPNRGPYLEIRVTRGGAAEAGADGSLTLDLARYDRNFLPLNPSWVGGGRPDVCAACDDFRIESGAGGLPTVPAVRSARCTRDRPYIDSGGCRPRRGNCGGLGSRLSGHVDWGPATFTGVASTVDGGPMHIARDGDAELFLAPDGGAGLVARRRGSKYDGFIGVEFNSAQTLRWFRTKWWRLFPFRSRSYRPFEIWKGLRRHPGVSGPYPSVKARPAAVIGLFNIDAAYGHSELHPAYAVSLQTASHADRDVYQVFARNWGTGGDCAGRLDHRLAVSRIVLPLKGSEGRAYADASGTFFDHGRPFGAWRVYGGTGEPAELVVELPADRRCAVVEGELTLRLAREDELVDDAEHFVVGEPEPGEPVRLEVSRGTDQLCVEEEWFVAVP